MANDAVKLDMIVPLKSQEINGRHMPAVDISKFNLAIDHFKIKIDISGSFIADISDAFVTLLKKQILSEIESVINKSVPSVAKDSIN